MSDPFRDDLQAAQARVEVLAREKAELEALATTNDERARIDNQKFWGATVHDDVPFPAEAAEPSLEGCGGGGD